MNFRGNKSEAVILSAARTPSGGFLGSLSGMTATELGAVVVKEVVKRAQIDDPAQINEVLLGNVVSAGLGQAPARQSAMPRPRPNPGEG